MAEMPNGAKPAGSFGSLNLPDSRTGRKFESKTSIVPAWKLVANRKAPLALKPRASPLYTAPEAELFTAMTVWVGSTLLLQPAMVPSSVANSSVAGPAPWPDEMPRPFVALVATPVGAEAPGPLGPGIVTAGWTALPAPSRLSAMPAPFSATHSPLLVPSASPQGFTRLGSVRA